MTETSTRRLLLPRARVARWCANFEGRHGGASYAVADLALVLHGADGATARLSLPFAQPYAGAPAPEELAAAVSAPPAWGVLLVRKGGFAVARLAGERVVEHKVGRRHVQGRTKAGGQSQQRFARRRANQARDAYRAAADHAARLLSAPQGALVCGGDRPAVDAVLADPRLRHLGDVRAERWLEVPDPRAAVLDAAVADALAIEVLVEEPADPPVSGRGRGA